MNYIISAYYISRISIRNLNSGIVSEKKLYAKIWYIRIYHVDHVANISVVIKTYFDDLEFNMM